MKLDDLKFTSKDVVQGVSLVVFLGSMWYDLKTQQLNQKRDIEFMQYQINELKNTRPFKQMAIIPRAVQLEKEERD